MRSAINLRSIVLISICCVILQVGNLPASAVNQRPFGIRDLIGWSYVAPVLGGPDGKFGETSTKYAKFSDDGAYFATRLTKGDLRRGVVLDTLLIYATQQVLVGMDSGKDIVAKPICAVQRPARSLVNQIDYVRWSGVDRLTFVAESDGGTTQVFALRVKGCQLSQLTHHPTDIVSYALNSKRIVFLAAVPLKQSPVVPVTGDTTLGSLLVPRNVASNVDVFRTVQMFDFDIESKRTKEIHTQPQSLYWYDQYIWLSPDGNYAVTRLPATDWPLSWQNYTIHNSHYPQNEWNFSSKDRSADANSYFLQHRHQYVLINLRDGNVRPLVDAPDAGLSDFATPMSVFWPRDKSSVIVSGTYLPLKNIVGDELEKRRSTPAIVRVSLPTGAVTPIVWEDMVQGSNGEITEVGFDKRNDQLVLTRKMDGSEKNEIYGESEAQWILLRSVNKDAPRVRIQVSQSLKERPKLQVVGRDCRCERNLIDPNPAAKDFMMSPVNAVSWKGTDGTLWNGGLLLPTNFIEGRRYPLVIQTHGFDHNQYLLDGPDNLHTAFAAQVFANDGFVVLQVEDKPLFNQSEPLADRLASGITGAITYLTDKGILDRDRVGALGFSITGLGVLKLAVHAPGALHAIVMADAFVDGYLGQLNLVNGIDLVGAQWRGLGISNIFQEPVAKWWDSKPISKAAEITAPMLVESVSADSTIAMWELYATMRGHGRPSEMIALPHGAHQLFNPNERLASQGYSVDWFRFWLQGYEDPAPDKADQYRRWEGLCDLQIAEKTGRPTFCVPAKH